METSIINHIIQTTGDILTPVIAIIITYFLAKRMLKYKLGVEREINLLKSVLYYKRIISEYEKIIDETNDHSDKKDIKMQIETEIGFKPGEYVQPARIRKRLEYLEMMDEKISTFITKINKSGVD
ncbi:MAG: hypothetical protein JXR70_10725 [Spirochaetales bacterium]|nr:hypothetical protein [Spirochaetales bacterium]